MKDEVTRTPAEAVAIRRAILERWHNHEFYRSALVLGLDIGIEGIGVWLRKGPECLFRGTFLASLPEAAPLKHRRQLRAARHARQSRRRRDRLLKRWVVEYGLLSAERAEALWANPRAFERAFEHRWRAASEDKALASPEALVVCIRHCVRHRGYDYHLLFRDENPAYPWGDDLNLENIRAWGKRGVLPSDYGAELKMIVQEFGDLNEEKRAEALRILDETIARYQSDPIRQMLEEHLRERQHVNLRVAARGHNFPRELVKAHLRQICERHRHFFPADRFEEALVKLIGRRKNSEEEYDPRHESIMDYHRRTPIEARKLWERREGRCLLAAHLVAAGLLPPGEYRRASAGAGAIRRWKVIQFLAERRVELATGGRAYVSPEIIREALLFVEADGAAWRGRQPRPRAPDVKKMIGKAVGQLVPDTASRMNKDFFDQLKDLLKPKLSTLRGKAPLAEKTAETLFDLATNRGANLDPEAIRARLRDSGYYEWRKQPGGQRAFHPQVDFLLGDPRQYDPVTGQPKDRRDGIPRYHGILRRLFAGQLRLDTGETVDLRDRLDGKTVPDYVVIESVRDLPRNTKQRRELQNEQKARREERRAIAEKYGYDFHVLNDEQARRLFLFHEQSNAAGEGFCPYTGESLGRDPLAPDLELEHIYPESRGGLTLMENLVITRRATNKEKGNRTPVEWLGYEKALEGCAKMRWSERKKAVFLWNEEGCPPWENLTRTAQLARELRRRVVEWLGIEQCVAHIPDPTERARAREREERRRVATPAGALTAACREAWKENLPDEYFRALDIPGPTVLVKNRGNLRHHMWDAGVLAQIPRGDGLNHVLYGGIFETRSQGDAARLTPLPELAPNIASIEKADPLSCRVFRIRPRHSKEARSLEQPVSLQDEQCSSWRRVAISKTKNKKKGSENILVNPDPLQKYIPDPLQKYIRLAGLRPDQLSDAEIERWVNDPRPIEEHPLRLRDGTPVYCLRLPIEQQKNEFARFPHLTDARTAPGAPAYRSRDGRREYRLIGIKGATETFDRLEIWRGLKRDRKGQPKLDPQGQPVWEYYSFPVPTARNIAAYRRMWGRPLAIRRPEGATERVGVIRKGDLLLAPFGPREDGKLRLTDEGREPIARLWLRVTAIKDSGEITMTLAEHEDFQTTPLKKSATDKVETGWRPSSPSLLARLLRETEAMRSRDSSSDSRL